MSAPVRLTDTSLSPRNLRTGPNGEPVRAGTVARQLLGELRRKQRPTSTRCPRCGRAFTPKVPPKGTDMPLCARCDAEARQTQLPGLGPAER